MKIINTIKEILLYEKDKSSVNTSFLEFVSNIVNSELNEIGDKERKLSQFCEGYILALKEIDA